MKKIQKNAVRFDNLKQDFLDDKKYSGTAEATLNGYRYDITRFLKFLSDEQLAVNEAGFKQYVIHLTDSGMTANSVNHYIRSVKVVPLLVHGAGRNSTVQNQDGKGTRNRQGRLHAGRTLCADSATET